MEIPKNYFDAQFQLVRDDIKHSQEELARMVSSGFKDVQTRLDVTNRMSAVEHDLKTIKSALHLS